MQRQIIKPQFDQPITVKLDFGAEGIQRDGKYGTEYQYTLNDDSGVMWLPKQGRDALLRTNAQAGDYVRILKTKKSGQNVFDAQVLSDAEEEEPAPVRQVDRAGNHSHHALPKQVQSSKAQPGRASAQPVEVHPIGEMAKRAFELAATVVLHSEAHCKSIGLPVEANFEDVRALAISFMIERSRNARGGQ